MSEESWLSLRAKLGGLSRDRAPDDPELVAARRDLAATRLAEHVRRVLEAAPPFTRQQTADVVSILREGGHHAA